MVVCTITDADGIKRVTVKDVATGVLTTQVNLDCTGVPTTSLTFRYAVPTATQKVIMVDCEGHKKVFRVKPDGTVLDPGGKLPYEGILARRRSCLSPPRTPAGYRLLPNRLRVRRARTGAASSRCSPR